MTGSLDWANKTETGDNVAFYMTVYGSLAGANSVFTLARAFLFAYSGIAAAKTVHQQLFSSIMKVSKGVRSREFSRTGSLYDFRFLSN